VMELEGDPPVLPEVRRCNRSSGQGWVCGKLAYPGYSTCLKHIKKRREYVQKKRAKKLRASTGSEPSVQPRTGGGAASVAGGQEGVVCLSSPVVLASANRSEVGQSAVPDDETRPAQSFKNDVDAE
jgi:hypothetical protein